MKEIDDLLKSQNIRSIGYKKEGNVTIVNTNKGLFVIKKNNIDDKVLSYLNNRGFKEYPETIFDKEYIISKYEDSSDIPNEQKMFDLIDVVGLLHKKTSFYKEVSSYEYKTIYENVLNDLDYLYNYYFNYINLIDQKIIYSPSEFLLSRSISYIFKSIKNSRDYINDWYKRIENLNKIRLSVIHNNLDLTHFIRNKKSYLISFDKSKIDMPIYDLYKLYNKYYFNYNFSEILKRYESIYSLKDYEKELLLILINIPNKINFTSEYNTCVDISNEIDRLYKSNELKNSLK